MLNLPRSPQRRHTLALLCLSLLCWGGLALPGTHATQVPWYEDLFTAVSAVSTTGLTTVPTGETYTWFGELVVLAFIQLGGLGYMGLLSFILLRPHRRLDDDDAAVVSEDQNLSDEVDVTRFVRRVLAFTAACEVLGAAVLAYGFHRFGLPVGEAVWKGVFHSVSAFCTAGFALQADSLQPYAAEPLITIAAIVTATLGSLGFILFTAVRKRFGSDDWGFEPSTAPVLAIFTILVIAYAVAGYYAGGPIAESAYPWVNAVFLAGTSVTSTGFSTVATGDLPLVLTMSLIVVMSFGASPVGTSGGMKLSNVVLLGTLVIDRLRGRTRVDIDGERVEAREVHEAVGVVALYLVLLVAGGLALAAVASEEDSPMDFDAVFFEAASALGNVGLSTGITADFDAAGRAILMALMLAGRIGAMTLAYSVASTREEAE